MSYNTRYHPHLCKSMRIPRSKRRPEKSVKWLLIFMALIMCICLYYRPGIREFFIPGNAELTPLAVEAFAENVKAGAPVDEALRKFCLDILDDAP